MKENDINDSITVSSTLSHKIIRRGRFHDSQVLRLVRAEVPQGEIKESTNKYCFYMWSSDPAGFIGQRISI